LFYSVFFNKFLPIFDTGRKTKKVGLLQKTILRLHLPKKLILLVAGLLLLNACSTDIHADPQAKEGILDARDFFSHDSFTLFLDGEWEFYPNQLLSPNEIVSTTTQTMHLSPGLWKSSGKQDRIKYATYRLRLINHELPPVFSIRNHQIYSAFRLYLNGTEILSNGVVSTNKDQEVPSYYPKTVSVYTTSDTLDFVLHVSNHHYHKGGIAESLIIGKAATLLRNNMAGIGFDFFLIGSLLIMALYYLSLFVILKKEQSSLYFSIFIILSILRILVTGQRLLLFLFPTIPWEMMLRLEYGTFYLAPVFFILFFNAVFREEVKIFVVNLVMGISGLFGLLVFITPVSFFSATLLFHQIYLSILGVYLIFCLIKARKNKKEGALVLLLGIVILFATLLHDMAFAIGDIRGREFFPAGIFLFIICQSYVLSAKFSDINKENQTLWEELDYKTQNLERLVKERTHELEAQKNLLEKTNMELEQKKQSMQSQGKILEEINELLEKEKEKSDDLLLNVLPNHIANELKLFGKSLAHSYPNVSVLFVDFVGFSELSEALDPNELLDELHYYFAGFDDIAKKYNLEKIKTIGDAYMCAGGLHENTSDREAKNTVMAALELNMFIQSLKEEKQSMGDPYFDSRIGIHTGPVIAGVVGKTKFSFDIWGPTVNIANRIEGACEPGKVNISESTYQFIKDDFECSSRGLITVKHGKTMQMFFVHGRKDHQTA
jgi:class 3 adenylate cyclase